MQDDEIERRRIGSSVVGMMRHRSEVRELAQSQLVQDFSGFGVAVIVALGGLIGTQRVQGSSRQPRMDSRVLNGSNQAVSPEQPDKPGHAGRGDELESIVVFNRQTQRRNVV